MEKEKTENRLSIGRINGVEIATVKNEAGDFYVPIKPICTALGIDFKVQHRKIEDDPSFSSVMVIMTTTGADRKQYDMVCLPIRRVYGWLYTINPGKVAPEARESVMKYRDQCNDVLYDYFFNKNQKLMDINRAEMHELEELRSLMTQEKEIKMKIRDSKERIDKIRAARLDDQPSLFD